MKHTLQSRFLRRVFLYITNDIVPTSNYKSTIKSRNSETVPQAIKSSPASNHVLQTRSPQIKSKDLNFPYPHCTTFFKLHPSVAPSISILRGDHQSPLVFFRWKWTHTNIHRFSCPLHCTSLTEEDLWERPCLTLKFLFGFPFFDLSSFPHHPSQPHPSNGHESCYSPYIFPLI